MSIQSTAAAPNTMNSNTDKSGESVDQTLEKEQSSGSEKNPAEENVADTSRQPPSEKAGDESDDNASPSNSTSDTSSQPSDASTSPWSVVWDDASQTYYWWNTITNETTWENPHEQAQQKPVEGSINENDKAGTPAVVTPTAAGLRPKTDSNNNLNNYYNTYPNVYRYHNDLPPQLEDSTYRFHAYFNSRTGKFQTFADVYRLNPERMSIENRATRQMQYYFDVHAYMEQRNRERSMGAPKKGMKRPLTKKDVERFKKAKEEKKMKRAREWLCD